VSEDPDAAPGPSTIATTLQDRPGQARVNGSFHDTDRWVCFPQGSLAGGLMGHAETGPLVLLSKVEPGGRPLGSYVFGTEVLRLVVRGSCRIGDEWYEAGDIRIEHAGSCGPVLAGDEGADEVIVIADRRALGTGSVRDAAWAAALDAVTGGVVG
jgi:hypothetical protein